MIQRSRVFFVTFVMFGAATLLPNAQAGSGQAPGALPKVDRHSLIYRHGDTSTAFAPPRFYRTTDQPLAAFAANVDTASYRDIQKFLADGVLPPAAAVRIEELVNHFRFTYEAPRGGHPVALTTEVGACPWAPSHRLVLIGVRAAATVDREIPGAPDTVATNVSFRIEFNPAVVQAWKQIGYDSKPFAPARVNDDRGDAEDLGAGRAVTVLYEVVPADSELAINDWSNGEWLTVNTRYTLPAETKSRVIMRPVRETPPAGYLPLASAVAEFGLILRESPNDLARWDALVERVARLRVTAAGSGDVTSFRELVETARRIARRMR